MMRFYYDQSEDCYFDLYEKDYHTLRNCIRIIGERLDETGDSVDDAVRHDMIVMYAEDIIKNILTNDQFELYKSASLY